MSNGSQEKLYDSLLRAPRLVPAIFSLLVLGLLLLFLRDLPEKIRTYLIPSIVVYCLGAAILGMFHRLIALHFQVPNSDNERTIPLKGRVILYMIHALWFLGLVAYNYWRCVL